jgi:hypothetical protein
LPSPEVQAPRPPISGIVWDIVLNATIPFAVYKLSKHYISPSELIALIMATTFPLGKSLYDLVGRAQLDPVAILVLLGIVTSGLALLLGGSPRLLLVRESLFTGALGLACFASLLLPRPMMFYFGRYFIAKSEPQVLARFDSSWQLPSVRFSHRLITIVWGTVFLAELILRIVLIYKTSSATVLIASPILLGTLTIATIMWTFRYAHRMRLRAIAQMRQTAGVDVGSFNPQV